MLYTKAKTEMFTYLFCTLVRDISPQITAVHPIELAQNNSVSYKNKRIINYATTQLIPSSARNFLPTLRKCLPVRRLVVLSSAG